MAICCERRVHVPVLPPPLLLLQGGSHVVLATLKRAQNDLSSYQRKIFKIDDHMGIAMAGLTADGRVLCKYMRNECINHRCVACSQCSVTDHMLWCGLVWPHCFAPSLCSACEGGKKG